MKLSHQHMYIQETQILFQKKKYEMVWQIQLISIYTQKKVKEDEENSTEDIEKKSS